MVVPVLQDLDAIIPPCLEALGPTRYDSAGDTVIMTLRILKYDICYTTVMIMSMKCTLMIMMYFFYSVVPLLV